MSKIKKLLRLLIAVLILPWWVLYPLGWTSVTIACLLYAWVTEKDVYTVELIDCCGISDLKSELIQTWASLYRWVKQ